MLLNYSQDMNSKNEPLKKIDTEMVRLNKLISNSGICSRREADKFIKLGMITVNGKTVNKMGIKVMISDVVKYDGQIINKIKSKYILINKPKGFLASSNHKKAKKPINDLINLPSQYKIVPIDNMGRTATGLLLLSNDLHFLKKLNYSKKGVKMRYKLTFDKNIDKNNIDKIKKEHYLNNKKIEFKNVSYFSSGSKKYLELECFGIQSTEIAKIFKGINLLVEQVDRLAYGSLTKKDLTRGKWRDLTSREIGFLQMH